MSNNSAKGLELSVMTLGFDRGVMGEARRDSADLKTIQVTAVMNRDPLYCLPPPFPGDDLRFVSLALKVRHAEELAEGGAPMKRVLKAARPVALEIRVAVSRDPIGILSYTHLAE